MAKKRKTKSGLDIYGEEFCYLDITDAGVYARTDVDNGEFLIAIPISDDDQEAASFIFLFPSDDTSKPPVIRGMDGSTTSTRRNATYIKCDHLQFTGVVSLKL